MGGTGGVKRALDKSYPQVYVISVDFALIAGISLSIAVFALAVSVISLVIHYVRRKETPEYTALSSQIRALEAELVDLMDKVKHWRNRDNVRRARQGAEEKLASVPEPSTPAEHKAVLRAKATAAGLGIR